MNRNMGTLDRGVRGFLVAPAAIVAAFILGAGTVLGIVLFVVAGIMLATLATGYCPTTPGSASRPRMDCIASTMGCSTVTPAVTRSFHPCVRESQPKIRRSLRRSVIRRNSRASAEHRLKGARK